MPLALVALVAAFVLAVAAPVASAEETQPPTGGITQVCEAVQGGFVAQWQGFGIFYPPNLTNDATGLADWSEEDIVKAVRTGVRPDGRQLAPIMPYHQYAALTDEDAHALARFLKSTKPVRNEVPDPVPPDAKPPLPYMTVVMPDQ